MNDRRHAKRRPPGRAGIQANGESGTDARPIASPGRASRQHTKQTKDLDAWRTPGQNVSRAASSVVHELLAVNLPQMPDTRNRSRAWGAVAIIALVLEALETLHASRGRDALQTRLIREAIARAEWLYGDARELADLLDWLLAAVDAEGGAA